MYSMSKIEKYQKYPTKTKLSINIFELYFFCWFKTHFFMLKDIEGSYTFHCIFTLLFIFLYPIYFLMLKFLFIEGLKPGTFFTQGDDASTLSPGPPKILDLALICISFPSVSLWDSNPQPFELIMIFFISWIQHRRPPHWELVSGTFWGRG